MITEPTTKISSLRRLTSLPIAAAEISLSRMARIMRPQGARYTRCNATNMTAIKIAVTQR